jgi:hypothetical protein
MASRISAPPLPITGLFLYSIQTLHESLCFLLVSILGYGYVAKTI